ncbi:SHD1 domain-containing protein [Aeoliella sp. ICT_H6.2]|uniref:SHD1 domain-containing protein n=1 Tax=Aeoliella straminimaris TaxID=2954799 RepID=A0A9X2JGM8_9BACT|nr:SHD1 domain-containing protein [Aeoliella straminimaris]MCO6045175.1 SHD1 domain-containing protein [Aeoliella straminimaris]
MCSICGRCLTWIVVAGLWLVSTVAVVHAETYDIGDRVEAQRGHDWIPGTVVGGSGTRIRVRLDDDGSSDSLPDDVREKRLLRNYYVSELRHAKGAAATAPAPSSTRPSRRTLSVPSSSESASPFDSAMSSVASRTWSDQSGRFSIDATYRGMNGAKVVLEKSDGSQIEVPLDKLSSADQDYVNSQGGDPENPFAVASSTPAIAPSRSAPLQADKSGARTLAPQTFDGWTFEPETTLGSDAGSLRQRTLTLSAIPDSDPFFEDNKQLYLAASGQRAVLVREQGAVARDKKLYLESFDLAAGKSTALAPLPDEVEVLAVDPDQGLVAYRPDHFGRGNTDLTIAQLRGTQLAPVATWVPYGDERMGRGTEVEAAWFLPEGRIMTLGQFGDVLTIWNASNAKATTLVPVSHGFDDEDLALSPDRRYAALKMDSGIAIVNLSSGEHEATIALAKGAAHLGVDRLAFNADNTKLAAVGHLGIFVWNLQTGTLLGHFDHETTFPSASLLWAGDFLFHQNRYLYDFHRHILLWEFEGISMHNGASRISNGVLCMVNKGRGHDSSQLRCMPFPTPEMIQTAERLGPPESLIVAKAGDPVAIELDIDERIISTEQVRAAIVANLEKSGYVVADKSDTVVKAVCKQLPSQTIKIGQGRSRFSVQPGDIVERTITPSPSSLTLSYKGQSVWRRGNMGQPGMTIWMRDGETLDQALTRLTTPNTKLLTDATFPTEIVRPGKASRNGAYGLTDLDSGVSGGGRFQ